MKPPLRFWGRFWHWKDSTVNAEGPSNWSPEIIFLRDFSLHYFFEAQKLQGFKGHSCVYRIFLKMHINSCAIKFQSRALHIETFVGPGAWGRNDSTVTQSIFSGLGHRSSWLAQSWSVWRALEAERAWNFHPVGFSGQKKWEKQPGPNNPTWCFCVAPKQRSCVSKI